LFAENQYTQYLPGEAGFGGFAGNARPKIVIF
jgi:hypothetical protein